MGQISEMTIVCLILSAIGCAVLPLGALIVFKKKTDAQWFPFFAGIIAYLFFIMTVEQMVHMLCLGTENPIAESLNQSPVLYAVYLSVTAAVFEEGGRYVMFYILRKKERGRETAVTFGIGFTLIEAVTVIMTLLSMVLVAVTLKSEGVEAYLSTVQSENLTQTTEAVQNFVTAHPASFLIPLLERIPSFFMSVGLSVLVFAAVSKRRPALFAGAVGLHILQNICSSLYQAGILRQAAAVEIVTIAVSLGIGWVAWRVYKTLPQTKKEQKKENHSSGKIKSLPKMY